MVKTMKSGKLIKIIPGDVPVCIKASYKQCHQKYSRRGIGKLEPVVSNVLILTAEGLLKSCRGRWKPLCLELVKTLLPEETSSFGRWGITTT